MDINRLIAEIPSANAQYLRPDIHIQKFRFSNDDYDPGRYIISDGADEDYGGFIVQTDSFPEFWFRWYDGGWHTNDTELRQMLEQPAVTTALAARFDMSVCLGPNGTGVDKGVWRKVISRCLAQDDSLVDELDVMYERENASSCNPACIPPASDDEWVVLPSLDSILKQWRLA